MIISLIAGVLLRLGNQHIYAHIDPDHLPSDQNILDSPFGLRRHRRTGKLIRSSNADTLRKLALTSVSYARLIECFSVLLVSVTRSL